MVDFMTIHIIAESREEGQSHHLIDDYLLGCRVARTRFEETLQKAGDRMSRATPALPIQTTP